VSIQTLREVLAADAAVRLNLRPELLQITFSPADEKVLSLAGPQFKFNIESRQLYNLGEVSWEVQIITGGGNKKVRLSATASAWQNELVLNKPVSFKQVLQDSDITERRTLVLRMAEEPLVTREEAIGQQAGRDLKSGTILTARMIDPMQLVSIGQFVSLTLQQGGVQIKTTARALEAASYGQSIRVKNEATGDVYQALITGPQEGTLSPLARATGASASAANFER
jgi:flagella basal body P-ring formation protein FlgA